MIIIKISSSSWISFELRTDFSADQQKSDLEGINFSPKQAREIESERERERVRERERERESERERRDLAIKIELVWEAKKETKIVCVSERVEL